MRDASGSSQRILKFVPPDGLPRLYAFGPFQFDPHQLLLTRGGAGIALAPKTSELLLVLLQSNGQLLSKEVLLATLWPDSFVEESNLVQNIFVLRKALGGGNYIETVPRRGYRFVARVELLENAPVARRASARSQVAIIGVIAVIAAVVAAALTGYRTLTPAQSAAVPSAAANEAYLKGRHHWNRRTESDFRKATEYYRTAVEIDPGFALAWAGLADAYNFLGDAPRAKVAATRALEIDEGLAEAHTAMANANMFYDFDPAAAERRLRRAIRIDPSYATAHQWYAYLLVSQGRFDEALTEIEQARRLDPASLSINTGVGAILYYSRRYDDAIRHLRRTIDLEPDFVQSRWQLGIVYARKGMHREAMEELKAIGPAGPDQLLEFRFLSGDREDIDRLQTLEKEPDGRRRGVSDYTLARAFAAAGDAPGTVRSLERARASHEADLLLVGVDPAFDPIRNDPAFGVFLRRHGFGR